MFIGQCKSVYRSINTRPLGIVSNTARTGLIFALMLFSAASVEAQPQKSFGAPKQVTLGSDFYLEVGTLNYHGADAKPEQDSTFVRLHPGVDYFLIEGLSIGVKAIFRLDKTVQQVDTVLGGGPRIGYAIGLGDRFVLWPRVDFYTGALWHKEPQVVSVTQSIRPVEKELVAGIDQLGIQLASTFDLPFLFLPWDNVAIGITPFVSKEWLRAFGDYHLPNRAQIGANFTTVAYF